MGIYSGWEHPTTGQTQPPPKKGKKTRPKQKGIYNGWEHPTTGQTKKG